MSALLLDPAEFFGTEAIQNPYPLYERLRAAGPVHRIGDSGFHLVCDWSAITEVVGRPKDFSSNLTATMTYTAEGGVTPFEMDRVGGPTHILVTADDPVHAAHRKLVVSQFTAKRVRALEPLIAEIFTQLWSEGLADGRIEWMAAVANRLPTNSLSTIHCISSALRLTCPFHHFSNSRNRSASVSTFDQRL